MSDELPVMTQEEWSYRYNAWLRGWIANPPPPAIVLVPVTTYEGCVFSTNPATPTNSPPPTPARSRPPAPA